MNQPDKDRRLLIEKAAGSFMLLCFGLGSLAFLIAIDRSEWFAVRPASGVAQAMANASDKYVDQQDKMAGKDGERLFRLTRDDRTRDKLTQGKVYAAN